MSVTDQPLPVLLVMGASPLLLVGLIFLLGYTLILLLGAALAAWLRKGAWRS